MIKSVKLLLLVIIFYAAVAERLTASSSGGQILELESSARISSMGESFSGLADDLNSINHNPAGLSQLIGLEIQLSHVRYFMDTNFSSLIIAKKAKAVGYGFQLKYFSAADVYRDRLGYNPKEFKIRFYQTSIAASISLSDKHMAGLVLNALGESYLLKGTAGYSGDSNAIAGAATLGWLYRPNYRDSFGISLNNIGSGIKAKDESSSLPFYVSAGAGHFFSKMILSWTVELDRDSEFNWKAGVQGEVESIFLRCGIKYYRSAQFSLGFGIPYGIWNLDYAFLPHEHLGAAHRISLGINY